MNIAIRVDASYEIGAGHVMRCLTLADGFKRNGANSVFICREHKGHLKTLINQKGYECFLLNNTFDVYDNVLEAYESPRHVAWLGAPWEEDTQEIKKIFNPNDSVIKSATTDEYQMDAKLKFKYGDFVVVLNLINVGVDTISADFNFHFGSKDASKILEKIKTYQEIKGKAENIVGGLFND